MKSVLISIKPKYCELIANGKKTIEVRRTCPKIETTFKCFIYETHDKKYEDIGVCWGHGNTFEHACGKVIGDFVCDKVYNLINAFGGIMFADENLNQLEPQLFRDRSCMTDEQTEYYLGNKDGYGWHISDLKIYDKPKELGEFNRVVENCVFDKDDVCQNRKQNQVIMCKNLDCNCKKLVRQPQSWCYVEEV